MKKNYLNTDLTIASDGNYVHVTESGRENFKKWFKESKVKNILTIFLIGGLAC